VKNLKATGRRTFGAAVLAAVLMAGGASARDKPAFRQIEAVAGDKIRSVKVADFNGDKRPDIVVMRTRIRESERKVEKYFDLFLQTPDGFPKAPDQSLKADDRAIVYDLGDIDPTTPGPDIAYVTSDGVFSYSFDGGRFAAEPRRILTVKSVFTAPDATTIMSRDLFRDYDGDGISELMIPDADQWYYFKLMDAAASNGVPQAADEPKGRQWRVRQIFPVPLVTELSNVWEGNLLVARLEYGTSRIVQLLPDEFLADYDGDGRKDLLIGHADRLLIFKAKADGNFAETPEIWDFARYGIEEMMRHGHLAPVARLAVGDINGDGKADVVLARISIKDLSDIELLTEFSVFLNKGGKFAASPDQVVHVDNYSEQPFLMDANGDGSLDLVYQEIPFGIWQAMRIALFSEIKIDYHVRYSKNGFFSDDNDRTVRIPFDFDLSHQGSGVLTAFTFDADFDADGIPDVLQAEGSDGYRLCTANGKKEWADECETIDVPQASFFTLPVDLNGDKKLDLIIRYAGEGAHDGTLRILLSH